MEFPRINDDWAIETVDAAVHRKRTHEMGSRDLDSRSWRGECLVCEDVARALLPL